jgi:hypothetical protein
MLQGRAMMFVPHRKHGPLWYVTGDRFTFLHVDDVRTSQEAWTTTVRYRESFAFYM